MVSTVDAEPNTAKEGLVPDNRIKLGRKASCSLSLVTWVGTPVAIARKMLEIAQAGPQDVLYDLGSGDGRILILAVKEFGVRKAVGYEIREDLCNIAEREIERLNLQKRITLIKGNLLEAHLAGASIITLYLSSEANEILRPKLEEYAKPRSRVVSYLFPINGWRAAREVDLQSFSFNEGRFLGMLYLYLVPQAFELCRRFVHPLA